MDNRTLRWLVAPVLFSLSISSSQTEKNGPPPSSQEVNIFEEILDHQDRIPWDQRHKELPPPYCVALKLKFCENENAWAKMKIYVLRVGEEVKDWRYVFLIPANDTTGPPTVFLSRGGDEGFSVYLLSPKGTLERAAFVNSDWTSHAISNEVAKPQFELEKRAWHELFVKVDHPQQ
jgi:hypothetical protein